MKKALSSLAASALILGAMAPSAFADSSSANPYKDINGNFAKQDIINLTQLGYIHGYKDGTYRPNDIITRGQFLAYFMNVVKSATGVVPKTKAQFFADIPPKNWDYNYVGAAWSAGWINPYWLNVKLGGRFNENYHASWGDAASFFVASMEKSGKIKSTGGQAPLAYTKSIGLFNGIPESQNHIYLNRASAAVFLDNVVQFLNGLSGTGGSSGSGGTSTGSGTGSGGSGSSGSGSSGSGSSGSGSSGSGGQSSGLPAGSTVTITGQNDMAPNSNEQLTLVVKDANGNPISVVNPQVTYSISNAAGFISQQGQLVVTTPGTYSVTATVDGVTSAPFDVTVYGPAAGIKFLQNQTQLVADGSAKTTLTLQVVDQSGNPVTNFNGTVNFNDTSGQLVGVGGSLTNDLQNVPVTNGVASVQVQATSTQGVTDTVTASSPVSSSGAQVLNNNNSVTASETVTQVPQVATSIAVMANSNTLENNVATADPFTVQVLDQGGQPMLTGVYMINLSVTGVGQFASGTQTSTAYVGNGTTTSFVNGQVMSEQGVAGAITVSANGQGLQSGSTTIQSLSVGSPAALNIMPAKNNSSSFAAGSSGSEYQIVTTDSSGHTVTDPQNPTYNVTVLQGNTQVTSGVSAVVSGNTILLTGTKAGTYTMQVSSTDNLSGTGTFTVTAGTPSTAVITSPVAASVELPIGANTMNIQGQLEDAYGNMVTQAGVPVELTSSTRSGTDSALLGGSSASQYTVTTGANGMFAVNFTGSHTIGDAWTVTADKINGNSVTSNPLSIKMVGAVPTQVHVSLEDTTSLANNNPVYLHSTTDAQAGDTVTVSISATDSFGNTSPNLDEMQITLPAGLTAPQGLTATSTPGVYTVNLPASGVVTFTATAAQAGYAQVQAQDLSVGSSTLAGSATLTVVPGPVVGAAVFSNSGLINTTSPIAIQANQPVQIWVKPVDIMGNPVAGGQQVLNIALSDGGKGGGFRLTSVGQNVTTVQIPVGSIAVPLYYVNGTAGSYVLSATVQ